MNEQIQPGDDKQTTDAQSNSGSSFSVEQNRSNQKASSENAGHPTNHLRVGRKRTLKEKWRLTSLSNKVIALATVVIAGASVLGFGTAVLQWLEMRDAGTQTSKIIAADERLATAMENSVKEAGNSLNATVDQFHLEQRAWVGIDSVVTKPSFEPNQPAALSVEVVNSGKTPAFKVKSHVAAKLIQATQKLIIAYDRVNEQPSDVLLPGMKFNIGPGESEKPIDATTSAGIKNRTLRVYLYGWISYEDVFKRAHKTTFCVQFMPNGAITCDQYNNAD